MGRQWGVKNEAVFLICFLASYILSNKPEVK